MVPIYKLLSIVHDLHGLVQPLIVPHGLVQPLLVLGGATWLIQPLTSVDDVLAWLHSYTERKKGTANRAKTAADDDEGRSRGRGNVDENDNDE